MAQRDIKLLQRGVNVQANDLAAPPGTTLDADNLDFDRDGVAQRRFGFGNNFTGLPAAAVDCDQGIASLVGGDAELVGQRPLLGSTRGFYSLFSGAVVFHLNNGMLFSGEVQSGNSVTQWLSVPMALGHQVALLGRWSPASSGPTLTLSFVRVGRAIMSCNMTTGGSGPFAWQSPNLAFANSCMIGDIGNDPSQAYSGSSTAPSPCRMRTAFDVWTPGTNLQQLFVSDDTSIRNYDASSQFNCGHIAAGSATVSGYTDSSAAASLFSGASWMTGSITSGGHTIIWVADNQNAIRQFDFNGSTVSTLAGSITAGDVDGVGTAARFRNISGIAISGGFLYVSESGGHRIRKVDINTASVTIYAGQLTPTAGYVDAVGTSARFNTPIGLRLIGDSLFVGDSGNGRVRKIVVSTASVTTYAGQGNGAASGMVPGAPLASGQIIGCYLPSVTVRSVYTSLPSTNGSLAAKNYLAVECQAPNASTDLGLLSVPVSGGVVQSPNATTDALYHIARCPNSYPSFPNGELKMGNWGINSYRDADVRAVDTQSGAVIVTTERPRIVDQYNRYNQSDSMPRLRLVGIDWPEAPSCTITAGSTFQNNTSWAYRTLCGMTLPNGRVVLGPPSERIIVTNTSGTTQSGSVTAYASPGLPYDGMTFIQVYRTKSTSSANDPGDQMFLCYEAPIAYGQGISFADICDDNLLGAELYTNNTQLTFAGASLAPPAFATDAASFNGRLALSNYLDQAYCRIKVLGTSPLVSGSSAITFQTITPGFYDAAGTITLQAATLTSLAPAYTPSYNAQFAIGTGGSAAQNAVQTARNIAYVINRCPDAFMLRAQYDESDPGAVMVYSVYPGRSSVNTAIYQSSSTASSVTDIQSQVTFSTTAPTAIVQTGGTPTRRRLANVRWSDRLNPDSFPVVNQATVGPSTESIRRILPIAETLIAVKDHTIYRADSSFAFQFYNQALSCSLPNSFARLNNQWIGLFTRGFMALSPAQANPIGRQLDRATQLRFGTGSVIFGTSNTDFASAEASEKRGIYLCRFNDKIFEYNDYSKIWSTTSWLLDQQPTYIGVHNDAFLFNVSDYPRAVAWQLNTPGRWNVITDLFVDPTYSINYGSGSITIVSGSGMLTDTPTVNALAGAVFYQGASLTTIYAATLTGGAYTVSTSLPVTTAGTATLYTPIAISALYAPVVAPGQNQKFGDTLATLELARAGTITATFYNRVDTGAVNTNIWPLGTFRTGMGVSQPRTIVLPAGATEFTDYVYNSIQRFPVPIARSASSELLVQLQEQTAFQPLAIKAVTVETEPLDNAKVSR